MSDWPGYDTIRACSHLSAQALAWPKQTAESICRAPPGKWRIVHIDARDYTPSQHGDYDNIEGVREALGKMIYAQMIEMKVYNDQGKEVILVCT